MEWKPIDILTLGGASYLLLLLASILALIHLTQNGIRASGVCDLAALPLIASDTPLFVWCFSDEGDLGGMESRLVVRRALKPPCGTASSGVTYGHISHWHYCVPGKDLAPAQMYSG
jgi:hypothetical protein